VSAADSASPAGEFVPATPELQYARIGAVATLTYNRPAARNAMTWAMYEGLYAACAHVAADDRVRVLVLRGADERAFVAGTDIAQFQELRTAADALDYEARISRYVGALEALPKPTIAALRGYCVGGGAILALACDLRVASTDVHFGVPIARTLGNTLALENVARVVALLGEARAKTLLLTGRLLGAADALALGLYADVVAPEDFDARVDTLAAELAANAPLTLRSLREAMRRLRAPGPLARADDLVLLCYLSADFREGVSAFLEKRPPRWQGR
jgi:enoyl-CoA hydratase/carnithine racemase